MLDGSLTCLLKDSSMRETVVVRLLRCSYQTLIHVVLTTNENIVNACEVMSSAISDHSLVCVTLKMKAPKPRCTYITVRSYKNYTHAKFIEDLASIPFYIANIFDDLDDHVYVFNSLFLDVLNDYASMK